MVTEELKSKFINGDAKILHIFADTGIECEVLQMYGNITRVGLNPKDNPFTDNLIKADATEIEFEENAFDLSIWHPPCQRFSLSTISTGNQEDHPNHIPIAREKAKKFSREYVIENVPQAPLEDPVMLNGKMFGLPIHYERAFETSWNVPQPQTNSNIRPVCSWDVDRGTGGWAWIGNKKLWMNSKGYSYDWPSEPITRSAIPRPYINYILRPLINDWSNGESLTKDKTDYFSGDERSLFDY